jgi:hypothetical protein
MIKLIITIFVAMLSACGGGDDCVYKEQPSDIQLVGGLGKEIIQDQCVKP